MNCSAHFQDAGVLSCVEAKIKILSFQKAKARTLSRLSYTPVLFFAKLIWYIQIKCERCTPVFITWKKEF